MVGVCLQLEDGHHGTAQAGSNVSDHEATKNGDSKVVLYSGVVELDKKHLMSFAELVRCGKPFNSNFKFVGKTPVAMALGPQPLPCHGTLCYPVSAKYFSYECGRVL
jgi:hypothetical protein